MNVLWLMNIIVPKAAQAIGAPVRPFGGWTVSQIEAMQQQKEISLTVCCVSDAVQSTQKVTIDGIHYVIFAEKKDSYIAAFRALLQQCAPDILQVFGTEQRTSNRLLQEMPLDKTVISIQGLAHLCAEVYLFDLPRKYRHISLLKAGMKQLYCADILAQNQKKFAREGIDEIASLQRVQHVIGRTNWDEACTKRINPQVQYHFCNETLRNSFYDGAWDETTCVRHSILVSQASYPIKGLHYILKELPRILQKYPDTMLCIAGEKPLSTGNRLLDYGVRYFFEYQAYCASLIRKNHLEKHVQFLGLQSEQEMKEQYLKANVFLSCSTLENESNSISEAHMLGVPVVSSFVGGVTERIAHGQDGFFYPLTESYMLPFYIEKLFDDADLCRTFSKNGRARARLLHDKEKNMQTLLGIYRSIMQSDTL